MGTGRDRQRGRLDGRITSIGWLVGLAVTGLVLATPHLHFAYRAESLHLILDACDGSVAVLVAYLLHGRFLRTRGLRELLLAQGMLLFALAGVGLDLLLVLFRDFRPQTIDVWVPLTLRVAGAGLVLAAALAGEHRLSRTGRLWVAGARVVLLGLVVALFLGRDQLPVALDAAPLPSARNPLITGHPLLLSGQARCRGVLRGGLGALHDAGLGGARRAAALAGPRLCPGRVGGVELPVVPLDLHRLALHR